LTHRPSRALARRQSESAAAPRTKGGHSQCTSHVALMSEMQRALHTHGGLRKRYESRHCVIVAPRAKFERPQSSRARASWRILSSVCGRSSGGDFAISRQRHGLLMCLALGSQNLRIVRALRTAVNERNIAEVGRSGASERSRNVQRCLWRPNLSRYWSSVPLKNPLVNSPRYFDDDVLVARSDFGGRESLHVGSFGRTPWERQQFDNRISEC
jgi:hypothetical protein